MCHTTNMAASCTSVPNIFMRRNRECHEPVERRKNTEIESEANAGTLIKIYVDDARPSAAAGPHRLTTCVLYVGVCVCETRRLMTHVMAGVNIVIATHLTWYSHAVHISSVS